MDSEGKIRVRRLIKEWVSQGATPQESFDWSKSQENWMRDLPRQKVFLKGLPQSLNRETIQELICDEKQRIENKFLATMIWGYGNLGYGSFRVKKMFLSDGFKEKIRKSFELSASGHAIEAYSFLSRNRITQLGPSFGTKWISFTSPSDNPVPIYDSLVAKWFDKYAKSDFVNVKTNSEVWNTETFSTYLNWMDSVSKKFNLKMTDIELIIFQDAQEIFSSRG